MTRQSLWALKMSKKFIPCPSYRHLKKSSPKYFKVHQSVTFSDFHWFHFHCVFVLVISFQTNPWKIQDSGLWGVFVRFGQQSWPNLAPFWCPTDLRLRFWQLTKVVTSCHKLSNLSKFVKICQNLSKFFKSWPNGLWPRGSDLSTEPRLANYIQKLS